MVFDCLPLVTFDNGLEMLSGLCLRLSSPQCSSETKFLARVATRE